MTSKHNLKKLAELLRRHSEELEAKKQEKTASILLAATALEMLRRKVEL